MGAMKIKKTARKNMKMFLSVKKLKTVSLFCLVFSLFICPAGQANWESTGQDESGQSSGRRTEQFPELENLARIRVFSAVSVNSSTITFGDIATPENGAIKAAWGNWEDLRDIKLWRAPQQEGEMYIIPRGQLREALSARLPQVADFLVVPERLLLRRGGSVLLRSDLERLTIDYLTPKIKSFGGEAELSDLILPSHIFLDNVSDRVDVDLVHSLSPGRVSLRISVRGEDGRVLRTLSGRVFFGLWKSVPVAAKSISPHDGEIAPESVRWERKNLAHLRDKPWDGNDAPLRPRTTIGKGNVIYASQLEPVPMITKGTVVTLLYNGSGVALRATGKATTDGKLGGVINVQNLFNNRHVTGLVRDAKTVIVK